MLPCEMWEYFGVGLDKVVNGESPVDVLRGMCKDMTEEGVWHEANDE